MSQAGKQGVAHYRTATGIRIRRTAITVLITNNPISNGVQKHFTSGGPFVEREQPALTSVIMPFLEYVVVVVMAAGLCSKICVTFTTPNSVQETQLGPRRGVIDPLHTRFASHYNAHLRSVLPSPHIALRRAVGRIHPGPYLRTGPRGSGPGRQIFRDGILKKIEIEVWYAGKKRLSTREKFKGDLY